MKYGIKELEYKAYQYRKRFLELFTRLGFGHLTSAFSWAEIATVLYHEILDFAPSGQENIMFDKMVVSKGHGAGILFPIFEDFGFFTKEEMEGALQIGGSSKKIKQMYYPGFDFYGGSLGIGLGVACGLAKGAKLQSNPWKVYCLVGDAECYEGSIWEAAQFAGHQPLDNLIVIVDRNHLGCSDFTEHMLKLEPFVDKWISHNWNCQVIDGHDIKQIYQALMQAKHGQNSCPHCIIANTKKGQGLNYLIDQPLMHGYVPSGRDIERAYRCLIGIAEECT